MRHEFPECNFSLTKWFKGVHKSLIYSGLTSKNVTDVINYLNGVKSLNNYSIECFILTFRLKAATCVHITPPGSKKIKRQLYLYLHRDFDLNKRHHWISLKFNPLYKKTTGKLQ